MKIVTNKVIAVIGSAGKNISEELKHLAINVGQTVIDNGFLLVTGGMGGVMQYAAKGARQSSHYSFGCIIGILPSYDKDDANEYIDIVIPTGLGVARNTVVVSTADIVIALDGGAGTLSELAMAWQMKKYIICIGNEGWHKRIANMILDYRDGGIIKELVSIQSLNKELSKTIKLKSFSGIHKNRENKDLLLCIKDQCRHEKLWELGRGLEGVVFCDGNKVYKVFSNQEHCSLLLNILKQISHTVRNNSKKHKVSPVPIFTVIMKEQIVVSYEYEKTSVYQYASRSEWIRFLASFRSYGVIASNFKADNLRVRSDNTLLYIDVGRDLLLYEGEMFRDSCLQAFCLLMCRQYGVQDKIFHSVISLEQYLGASKANLEKKFLMFYEEVLNGG